MAGSSIINPQTGLPFESSVGGSGTPENANVRDPLRDAVQTEWSDLSYLHELFHLFAAAIQQGVKKDYQYPSDLDFIKAGSPTWGEGDTFEDWCSDTETMLTWRMAELKAKVEQSRPSDKQFMNLLESGEMNPANKFIGRTLDNEDEETYEFILRKSMEAVIRYRKGQYTLQQVMTYAGKS